MDGKPVSGLEAKADREGTRDSAYLKETYNHA